MSRPLRRSAAVALAALTLAASVQLATGRAAADPGPACPTARPTTAAERAALVALVVPPRLGGRPAPAPTGTAPLLRRALQNVDRYALSTLYRDRALDPADRSVPADSPRSAGAEALALAATLATGAYDPAVVGHPADRARAVATWLVGAGACAHAAVTPGGWGAGTGAAVPVPTDLHGWLSPLAAAQLGQAGWVLWAGLGDTDRYDVAVMVAAEADLLLRTPPGYQLTETGRLLFPGDTKAEEDAWLTGVLGLASAMMPGHPHAARWRRREAAFQLAAFATAADAGSLTVVNGRPLQWWLDGSNVAADGTVVNHGINPHPDYMAMGSLNLAAGSVDTLAGRSTLRAAVFGVGRVYRSLVTKPYPAPPYAAPAGPVYPPGSGRIHYPVRSDWGTALVAHFVGLDATAAGLGVSDAARGYLRLHTQVLLGQQARAADGRTFQGWDEFRYADREQWVAEQLARAWLVEWATGGGVKRLPVTDGSVWLARRAATP